MKTYSELTYRGQVRRLRTLARAALDERGHRWDRLEFIFHGENTTFRVRRGAESWLLRIHRPGYQSDEAIRSELVWLAMLHDVGLNVPRPVGGVQHISVEGLEPRRVVLFEWTHGRFAGRLSRSRLRLVGRLMAELHVVTRDWEAPEGFVRPRLDIEGLVGDTPVMGGGLHLVPEPYRACFEQARGEAAELAETVWIEGENVHLIHADLHQGNYLFPGPSAAAAIDFDDCGFGHQLYDIAVTLGAVDRDPDAAELTRAFVAGYREVRPLSANLLEYLPVFRALRTLTIAFWVYGRTDNPFFVERAKKQGPQAAEALERALNAFPR